MALKESATTLKPAIQVGGQAVLGRQSLVSTPWLTERHGYDPTCSRILGSLQWLQNQWQYHFHRGLLLPRRI